MGVQEVGETGTQGNEEVEGSIHLPTILMSEALNVFRVQTLEGAKNLGWYSPILQSERAIWWEDLKQESMK